MKKLKFCCKNLIHQSNLFKYSLGQIKYDECKFLDIDRGSEFKYMGMIPN